MAEYLISANGKGYEVGDIVDVKDEGHEWGRFEVLPDYVVLVVLGELVDTLLIEPWRWDLMVAEISRDSDEKEYVLRIENRLARGESLGIPGAEIVAVIEEYGGVAISEEARGVRFNWTVDAGIRARKGKGGFKIEDERSATATTRAGRRQTRLELDQEIALNAPSNYKRRRFCIPETDVDSIVTAGGRMTITGLQFRTTVLVDKRGIE